MLIRSSIQILGHREIVAHAISTSRSLKHQHHSKCAIICRYSVLEYHNKRVMSYQKDDI